MLSGMDALLGIGDFSRMTFLSVKTLRHYHDVGLLEPAAVDADTGYRHYAIAQVPQAQVIRRLRELGMSIDDVRVVMNAPDVGERNAAITEHLRRMEVELEQTRSTVKALRLLLDQSAPARTPVSYRTVGPTETLAIRATLAYDDAFGWLDEAFAELGSVAGDHRSGPDAALYSSEILEDEVGELVAIVPVGEEPATAGRAERVTLPRVEYAVAVHHGSVDDIDRTYAALGAVVARRAIGVQGPIREDYVVTAADTPDTSRHRTEISWPVFHTTPPA
jgi:DNA-binding transcriptional MerR regulator